MFNTLLASCRKLPEVSSESADAYIRLTDQLLELVNEQLEADPKIKNLIGHNPFQLMYNNHRNHATFMATIFRLNSFELLIRTIPWVYRAYHARGFLYDYFPRELVAWQIALLHYIEKPGQWDEIIQIYSWLVQHHEDIVKLSLTGEGLSFSLQSEADEMQEIFLSLLLHGDTHGCLKLAEQSINTTEELKHFYLKVVWPSMTKIGQLWELNQISVAEEHLSTAIVGRVMAALYLRFAQFTVTRGTVVVSAGPNEFHEIGARMVADFMEMAGWDVVYLGANTPTVELLECIKKHTAFAVALSVATVFNIDNANQTIKVLKEDMETSNCKILIGGLAFSTVPELWREIGADGSADNAENAVEVLDAWWKARNDQRC